MHYQAVFKRYELKYMLTLEQNARIFDAMSPYMTDSNGNEIISHAPDLSFAVVILSCPDIIKGETYTITVGSASGDFTAS